MVGVTAIASARGAIVAGPGSADPVGHNLGRVDVVESTVGESVRSMQGSPSNRGMYGFEIERRFVDWWRRRLDTFLLEPGDPRVDELFEAQREKCRRADEPIGPPEVVEPATGESGIVELILTIERRQHAEIDWGRGNSLLVDLIRLQRSRW